jgi:lysophospholipase L1-like esterase
MIPHGSTLAAAVLAGLAASLSASCTVAQTAVQTAPADQARVCADKAGLNQLTHPLAHVAQRIANGKPITIVALGSSSTAGAGASSPAASYPSRLEAELSARFPEQPVTVINQGVNGEEAAEMLARFDESVARARPDLVLWQVGTNAVLRDNPLGPVDRLVHDGIARMKALGADVVLIDPQFAPKVIAKADAEDMVNLISAEAKQGNVDLFPRFAIMREWRDRDGIPFEAFLSPDLLHMNDWSYACIAKLLAVSISEAATRPFASARAGVRPAAPHGR